LTPFRFVVYFSDPKIIYPVGSNVTVMAMIARVCVFSNRISYPRGNESEREKGRMEGNETREKGIPHSLLTG